MVVGVVAEGFGAFGSLEVGEFGLMEFSHFPVEKFDLVEQFIVLLFEVFDFDLHFFLFKGYGVDIFFQLVQSLLLTFVFVFAFLKHGLV